MDGADSSYINEEDEDLILIHFPNAEIITINNSGHWVHAQQPKQFFKHFTFLSYRLTDNVLLFGVIQTNFNGLRGTSSQLNHHRKSKIEYSLFRIYFSP